MAWIQIDESVEVNRKLIELRTRMRWSKNECLGFITRFWLMVIRSAPSGDIGPLSDDVKRERLELDSRRLTAVIGAMEKIGLLDRRGEHLLVHDWLQYAGRYLKDSLWKRRPERWEEALRMHALSADCPQTDRGLSAATPHHTQPNHESERDKGESGSEKPDYQSPVKCWLQANRPDLNRRFRSLLALAEECGGVKQAVEEAGPYLADSSFKDPFKYALTVVQSQKQRAANGRKVNHGRNRSISEGLDL